MNALQLLQQKAGTTPDGKFGPATFAAAKQLLGLTDNRAVHFFAQCCHESGHFKYFSENLNYSADALLRVFGKYFKDQAQAEAYARQPEKIANRVYANRMGNGDESTGDGWKYRGRGAIQLTGKNNYVQFAQHIGNHALIVAPDAVETDYAFDSALYFFNANNLWEICDRGITDAEVTALTRRINGGFNGLGERIKLTEQYAAYTQRTV